MAAHRPGGPYHRWLDLLSAGLSHAVQLSSATLATPPTLRFHLTAFAQSPVKSAFNSQSRKALSDHRSHAHANNITSLSNTPRLSLSIRCLSERVQWIQAPSYHRQEACICWVHQSNIRKQQGSVQPLRHRRPPSSTGITARACFRRRGLCLNLVVPAVRPLDDRLFNILHTLHRPGIEDSPDQALAATRSRVRQAVAEMEANGSIRRSNSPGGTLPKRIQTKWHIVWIGPRVCQTLLERS